MIKTSDTPHLTGLCWNLGWILLYKFFAGKNGRGKEQESRLQIWKSGGKGWREAPTSRC